MNKHQEICDWLRDNSSGVYRKAAEAACIIEEQQKLIATLESNSSSTPQEAYKLIAEACDKCETRSLELCKDGKADGEECITINRARFRLSQAGDELMDYMEEDEDE